jgi:hypothetical protein
LYFKTISEATIFFFLWGGGEDDKKLCCVIPSRLFSGVQVVNGTKDSIWWKDVLGIGRGVEVDWFKSNVSCCVNIGYNIDFWKFKWFENQPFSELFPSLFLKEAIQDVTISDRLSWNSDTHMWTWQWREALSDGEIHQLLDLQNLLADFSPLTFS